LEEVDAILTSSVPVVAPVPGQWIQAGDVYAPAQFYMVRNTYLFNHTGLPAISVPCGRSEGLPVGLQIAGRPWDEALVLQIARTYERAVAA
jgi:aspartyl-tRNA(Asn)/glutamyl-tRNA(Gln) amidotransferase subunit A